MVTCPQCGLENIDNAPVCARCYAILKPKLTNESEPTYQAPSKNATEQAENWSTHQQDLARQNRAREMILNRYSVVLYIENTDQTLQLQVPENAFLGRASESILVHPLLDLTPFGGLEKGVSRLHAVIHRLISGISIEDLNSSNGTWVNDARLFPYTPHTLSSGDRILLGRFTIIIYFGVSDDRGSTRPLGEISYELETDREGQITEGTDEPQNLAPDDQGEENLFGDSPHNYNYAMKGSVNPQPSKRDPSYHQKTGSSFGRAKTSSTHSRRSHSLNRSRKTHLRYH